MRRVQRTILPVFRGLPDRHAAVAIRELCVDRNASKPIFSGLICVAREHYFVVERVFVKG